MERFLLRLPKPGPPATQVSSISSVESIASNILDPESQSQEAVAIVGMDVEINFENESQDINGDSDEESFEGEEVDNEYSSTTDSSSNLASDKTQKRKKYYHQKYNSNWAHSFPWLLSKSGGRDVFCKCCNRSLTCNLNHVKRHGETIKHKKNFKISLSTPKLTTLPELQKSITLNKKTQIAEYNVTMFLHEHNLPFLLMDHLPKMLRSAFPDSDILKNFKCSRTKATEVTRNCLAKEAMEEITAETQNNVYSLIIDETTDVSTKKSLAIVIRYHNGTHVKDRFLCLAKVRSCTAESLSNTICEVLHTNKIPLKNLVGFAADNANVMMGDKAGVQARFKELNPNLFVMGCVCHSFALCSSAACLKLPRVLEEFARQIYNHFSNSSKRVEELHQFQNFTNLKPHKMLHPAQTRWLSLQAVVERILLSWEALLLYFTSAVAIDGLRSTQIILDSLNTPIFKVYFLFLAYILAIVNKLNIEFQSEKPKIHVLLQKVSDLYRTVLRNYVSMTYLNSTELNNVSPSNPEHFLPIEKIYFETQVQLMLEKVQDLQEIQKFKVNALAFYVELCNQIKKRFNFKEPLLIFLTNFAPSQAVSGEVLSIVEIIHFFPQLNVDLDLNTEWRYLADSTEIKQKRDLDFEEFWLYILNCKNSLGMPMFPNLAMIIKWIMRLPHSSACAERIFSQLNLLKTKVRNRLEVDTCDAILHAKDLLGNDNCTTWEPSASLLLKKPKYDFTKKSLNN